MKTALRRILLIWCAAGLLYTALNQWWIPAVVFAFGFFLSAKE